MGPALRDARGGPPARRVPSARRASPSTTACRRRTWRSTSRRSAGPGSCESVPGRRGATASPGPAAEITVLDVVEAIDGPEPAFTCTRDPPAGPAARAGARVPAAVLDPRGDGPGRRRLARRAAPRRPSPTSAAGRRGASPEGLEKGRRLDPGGDCDEGASSPVRRASSGVRPSLRLIDAGHDGARRSPAATTRPARLRGVGAEPVDRRSLRRRRGARRHRAACDAIPHLATNVPPLPKAVGERPGRRTTGCASRPPRNLVAAARCQRRRRGS